MEFLIAYAHGQHFVGVGLDLELFDTASHSEHFSHTGNRLQSPGYSPICECSQIPWLSLTRRID